MESSDIDMSERMMQAIRVYRYGGPEELQLEQIPCPKPRAGEVLVRVYAAGVLPVEWKIRQGFLRAFHPSTFPYTPGSAFAGVIEELGMGVAHFEVGQAVFGRSLNGTYAEYTHVSSETIAVKPGTLSFDEVAAISGGATTAWEALFERGKVQAGQRVMIVGAAGGVGSFAVQFAKWKGAEVIGTTSTGNVTVIQDLGADRVVDYTTTRVEEVVQDVDVVFDTVGGEALASVWPTLKRGGKLISITGRPAPEKAQELEVDACFFSGSAPTTERLQVIAQLIAEGKIKVLLGSTFSLPEARAAHELSQRGHGRGRIILTLE